MRSRHTSSRHSSDASPPGWMRGSRRIRGHSRAGSNDDASPAGLHGRRARAPVGIVAGTPFPLEAITQWAWRVEQRGECVRLGRANQFVPRSKYGAGGRGLGFPSMLVAWLGPWKCTIHNLCTHKKACMPGASMRHNPTAHTAHQHKFCSDLPTCEPKQAHMWCTSSQAGHWSYM